MLRFEVIPVYVTILIGSGCLETDASISSQEKNKLMIK